MWLARHSQFDCSEAHSVPFSPYLFSTFLDFEWIMTPLKTTKRVLTWLCVYPTDKLTSKWKKMGFFMFSLICFVLNLNGLAASAAYFLKYVSDDLESALYALFQTDSLTAIAYTHILLLLSRREIIAIFENLFKIYDARNYICWYFSLLWFLICVQELNRTHINRCVKK